MVIFPYIKVAYYEDGKPVYLKEGTCDSGDTKPTGNSAFDIAEGSYLVESDTGNVFFYNKGSDVWNMMFTFKE